MLTVMDTIRQRRSVRSFKPDPVRQDVIDLMLEAARLAPSGSNRQPWRFQVVTDSALRQRIFDEATYGSKHILEAPLIIVCGCELLTYVRGNPLAPSNSALVAEGEDWPSLKPFIPDAAMNMAIAVEHMVLVATAEGVGTCWVQRIKPAQLARLLGWPPTVAVILLLLAGYAREEPMPKPRLPIDSILIKPWR